VAARAGVSKGTASKALNGRRDVGESTRRRVLDAARELDFAPNSLARGLSGGRTGTVGVITDDLDGRFVLPILMGAEDALGAGRISVLLCNARGDSVREAAHLQTLLARGVDGLIVVGDSNEPRPALPGPVPVPVVYVYAPSADPGDVSLTPDNELIGRLATRHLLDCGRTRIAHISGEAQHRAARDRARAVFGALDDAGAELVTPPMFGDWSAAWGRAAAALLHSRVPDVDGIICGSDRIALGVIEAIQEQQRTVPGDVSVVGIDNWRPLAEDVKPALTTVDLGLEQLGRIAAQHIFAMLEGATQPRGVQRLGARLIIRDSSVPLR
jgi:LacI family transcriptional regulator